MRNLLISTAALAFSCVCYGQEITQPVSQETHPAWAVKTNILSDITGTINLGAEFRLNRNLTLDLPLSWNPWEINSDKKWKHILLQPEVRWWTGEVFQGSFLGLHAHYAYYNVGGLPNPPFSDYMNEHRFQGWLLGAGVSYGYRWNFNHKWAMEATVGVGYAYLDYDKYPCAHCSEKISSEVKNYFGPTKAAISLIYGFGGQKKAPHKRPEPVYTPVVPVTPVALPEPEVIQEPKYAVSYVVPEVEDVKRRCDTGKAYLDFVVGRSEILPSFKNNATELDKIHQLIGELKNDPYATMTGITITGYASPEGSYESNLVLSERRARALKDHFKAMYGFRENFFAVSGEGEDWATLDILVAASNLSDKYRILEIIRGIDHPDSRDSKLMALSGGNTYQQLKADYYPQLRRSDYELHYTVVPFTVEKGKEVFRTKPSSLSLNEMYMVAGTYEPGSDSFNEVFETAVRIFPGDDVANLNAAATALHKKDTQAATRYLRRVQEGQSNKQWGRIAAAYWNNKGILAAMEGDRERATTYFIHAEDAGSTEAAANRKIRVK